MLALVRIVVPPASTIVARVLLVAAFCIWSAAIGGRLSGEGKLQQNGWIACIVAAAVGAVIQWLGSLWHVALDDVPAPHSWGQSIASALNCGFALLALRFCLAVAAVVLERAPLPEAIVASWRASTYAVENAIIGTGIIVAGSGLIVLFVAAYLLAALTRSHFGGGMESVLLGAPFLDLALQPIFAGAYLYFGERLLKTQFSNGASTSSA